MAQAPDTPRSASGAPGENTGPALNASHLSKTFGQGPTAVHALADVSLQVGVGEFVVLLGPSGSGKTTLLNVIGALEPPTSGDIRVMGRDVAALRERDRSGYRLRTVGFVFQFFNLVPTLTARENVALLAELTGEHANERTERVLRQVGLGDRMDHFPAELSGGEQQRVSIARGLVKGAPLLLCDEPTGALDVTTGVHVLRALRESVAEDGRTVVVVTHNAVIAGMADRVVRMLDGRIVGDERNPTPSGPEDLTW